MAELDIARIKGNLAKMAEQGATEAEMDAYVAMEGTSPEELRSFKPPAPNAPPLTAVPVPNAQGVVPPPAGFNVGDAYSVAEPGGVPYARGVYGVPQPTYDSPPQPNRTVENLAIGTQGTLRGLNETVMMPFDTLTGGFNAVLATGDAAARQFGGSLPFRMQAPSQTLADIGYNLADRAGLPVVDTDQIKGMDRLGYNASRFGTQALVFPQLLRKLAETGLPPSWINKPQDLAAPASVAPKPLDPLLANAAKNPERALKGETAAGVGAGTGLTVSQSAPESVRDSAGGMTGPIMDFVAMLTGGVGGGTTYEAASGGPKTIVERFRNSRPAPEIKYDPKTGEATTNRAADLAAEFVQGQAVDPQTAARTILSRTGEYQAENLPAPTAGLVSGDEGLEALERAARLKNNVPFIQRDTQLRDEALRQVDSLADPTADPMAMAAEARRLADERISAAEAEVAAARQKAEALAKQRADEGSALAPMANTTVSADASRRLDTEIVDKSLKPMAQRQRELYQAIDPEGSVTRPIDALLSVATKIEEEAKGFLPSFRERVIPQRLIDDIKSQAPQMEAQPSGVLGPDGMPLMAEKNVGGEGTISFKALNESRPVLSEMEAEARAANQFQLADRLRQLRDVIGLEAEALAAEGSQAGQAAKEALTFTKTEMGPTWKPGPGDAAQRFREDYNADPKGRTLTPPSETAGRFLTPDQPEAAQALFRVLEKTPDPAQGAAAARDFVISDMARSGILTPDNMINASSLRTWRNRWGSVLDGTPQMAGVKAEIDGLISKAETGKGQAQALAAEIKAKETALGLTKKDIDNGALGLVLGGSKYGNNPSNAVASVLSSGNPQMAMRDLKNTLAGNEAAVAGLKRAVADHLIEKVTNVADPGMSQGTTAVSFPKLQKMFRDNETVLAEVFTPEEMNALRRSHKLLEPLVKRGGRSTVGSPTTENNEAVWRTLEAGLKLTYGVLKGGGIIRSIKLAASTFGDDSAVQAQRLVERMWFDPELAAHILTRKTKEVGTPAWTGELQRIMRYNEAARGAFSQDDEEPSGNVITVSPKR